MRRNHFEVGKKVGEVHSTPDLSISAEWFTERERQSKVCVNCMCCRSMMIRTDVSMSSLTWSPDPCYEYGKSLCSRNVNKWKPSASFHISHLLFDDVYHLLSGFCWMHVSSARVTIFRSADVGAKCTSSQTDPPLTAIVFVMSSRAERVVSSIAWMIRLFNVDKLSAISLSDVSFPDRSLHYFCYCCWWWWWRRLAAVIKSVMFD